MAASRSRASEVASMEFSLALKEAITESTAAFKEDLSSLRASKEALARSMMPQEGGDGRDVCTIAIRDPLGVKVVALFYKESPAQVIYDLVGSWEVTEGREFTIDTPRREEVKRGRRIEEAGLGDRGLLVVRFTD
jgi:hypothetical protein